MPLLATAEAVAVAAVLTLLHRSGIEGSLNEFRLPWSPGKEGGSPAAPDGRLGARAFGCTLGSAAGKFPLPSPLASCQEGGIWFCLCVAETFGSLGQLELSSLLPPPSPFSFPFPQLLGLGRLNAEGLPTRARAAGPELTMMFM